ncbi:MAG: hypothetical protein QM831_38730 [Kofleriaceae bacterium]
MARGYLAALLIACSTPKPAPVPAPAAAPALVMSDPDEYRIARISRDAGEAIFAKTGIGDPYRTGIPYPIYLALFERYPQIFGRDWQELAAKFGFIARAPDRASTDLDRREGLPLGLHLAIDPITNVPFVMSSCALCHAEHVRWAGGEATVIGLGSKHVRIHAYDAAFFDLVAAAPDPGTIARTARKLADARGITWPEQYAQPFVAATLDAIGKRERPRADLIARTRDGAPGRVATIEAFTGALENLSGHSIDHAPEVGWAKVPDVIGFGARTTLSWDGSQQGSMDVLVVEADLAIGIAVEWLLRHPFQGPSLGAYLRQPEPRPAFPRPIDRALADRGKRLFEDQCAHCHGHYAADGRVRDYTEQVVPLEDLKTDPARAFAPTATFERAANQPDVTHGFTTFARTGGYVPPVLTNVWMRAPYGHAGQWASLAVMATPPEKRIATSYDLDAPYDLDRVGVVVGAPAKLDVGGHPFLADLGRDAPAVIEYLKSL